MSPSTLALVWGQRTVPLNLQFILVPFQSRFWIHKHEYVFLKGPKILAPSLFRAHHSTGSDLTSLFHSFLHFRYGFPLDPALVLSSILPSRLASTNEAAISV
jgi:hypothetical protein